MAQELTSTTASTVRVEKSGIPPVFNNRHLRFVFVAFLFSAALAEVGRQAIRVFNTDSIFWPAITHLTVAFIAISMSWVYWARTINDDATQLKDVFSSEFVLLLLDLLLVMLYMGIVASAEVPTAQLGSTHLPPASAIPESVLLACVYGFYAVWDLVHDVLGKHSTGKYVERPRYRDLCAAIVVRCGASAVSFMLALAVVLIARRAAIESTIGVCLLNIAELGNLVLFRALKAFEFRFDSKIHVVYREEQDKYPAVRRRMKTGAAVGCATYLGGVGGAIALS